MGCEVYRLYSDNTEGLCVDAKEIADHAAKGGMLGISKESWMAALEKENYLKAAEMSMEDDYGMIDGIINNGPKEDKTAEVKAPERGEKSSIMDRLKSAKAEKQKECCDEKTPRRCARCTVPGAFPFPAILFFPSKGLFIECHFPFCEAVKTHCIPWKSSRDSTYRTRFQ